MRFIQLFAVYSLFSRRVIKNGYCRESQERIEGWKP
jgi:hypothetical protein